MTEAVSTEATPTVGGIIVAPQAAARLKEEMKRRGGDKSLRLMVFPGGCAGLTYALSFTDAAPEEFETTVESEGIRVYVDTRYMPMLEGSTIRWIDNLIGGGFKVENPKAAHTCGCGKSFG